MSKIGSGLRSLRRKIKDSQYEAIEVKVREATSNEKWGASSTLMHDIAEATFERESYAKIFLLLWKRLTDFEHMQHCLKALFLVEYLLRHANQRFVADARDRQDAIKQLRKYKYYKDGVEVGGDIRNKAESVYALLMDDDAIKRQRATAERTKKRIGSVSSGSGAFHNTTSATHTPDKPRRPSFGSINEDQDGHDDDQVQHEKTKHRSHRKNSHHRKSHTKKANNEAGNDPFADDDEWEPTVNTNLAVDAPSRRPRAPSFDPLDNQDTPQVLMTPSKPNAFSPHQRPVDIMTGEAIATNWSTAGDSDDWLGDIQTTSTSTIEDKDAVFDGNTGFDPSSVQESTPPAKQQKSVEDSLLGDLMGGPSAHAHRPSPRTRERGMSMNQIMAEKQRHQLANRQNLGALTEDISAGFGHLSVSPSQSSASPFASPAQAPGPVQLDAYGIPIQQSQQQAQPKHGMSALPLRQTVEPSSPFNTRGRPFFTGSPQPQQQNPNQQQAPAQQQQQQQQNPFGWAGF